MTFKEIAETLIEIKYKDWSFSLFQRGETVFMLVLFEAPGPNGEQVSIQKGRKWVLSQHMTKSEVVATAFKAILTAEEHETRENFKYRGAPIFHPHYNVDILVEVYHNEDRRGHDDSHN